MNEGSLLGIEGGEDERGEDVLKMTESGGVAMLIEHILERVFVYD